MDLNVFVPTCSTSRNRHSPHASWLWGLRGPRARLGKPCWPHQRERQPQGPTRLSLHLKNIETTPCKVVFGVAGMDALIYPCEHFDTIGQISGTIPSKKSKQDGHQ